MLVNGLTLVLSGLVHHTTSVLWNMIPDKPQYSEKLHDAGHGSEYKLVVDCLSPDECCQQLRYQMLLNYNPYQITHPPPRASNDPLVESVHDDISYFKAPYAVHDDNLYAPGTKASDFEPGKVGLFSCRDTTPWRGSHASYPDKTDIPMSRKYDYLPIRNGVKPNDASITLDYEDSKYRYNYYFRCPKGYELIWDESVKYHYSGWFEFIIFYGEFRAAMRPRKTLICSPKMAEDIEERVSEVLSLGIGVSQCLEKRTSNGGLISVDLQAREERDPWGVEESDYFRHFGLSMRDVSIMEKGGQVIEKQVEEMGPAWSRVVQPPRVGTVYRACLTLPRLPDGQGQTRVRPIITLRLRPVGI